MAKPAKKLARNVKGPRPATPAATSRLTVVTLGVSDLARARRFYTIHSFVSDVEECIRYRLPAFRYQGRIIAGFAPISMGCSYYPFSATTLKPLAVDVEGHSTTKGALQFGPDKTLPTSLVRKLPNARIAEGGRST
jgi:uncharacterized protein YdhG (YjbR/CyaY superfamily)